MQAHSVERSTECNLSTTDMVISDEISHTSSACSDYGERLLEVVEETNEVSEFRAQSPRKFRAICFLQLSFAIHVPPNLCHECDYVDRADFTHLGRRLFTRPRRCNGGDLQPIPLTHSVLTRLNYLIALLEDTGAFRVEGIFRKTGSLTQQRVLIEAILQPNFDCYSFAWVDFSSHELAGALKSIIGRLAHPLLTSTLTPLFLEASRLYQHQCEDGESCSRRVALLQGGMELLSYGKQVNCLRLLTQLLPPASQTLLRRLLRLLRLVATHAEHSRMTSFALGTVFAPLFAPVLFAETTINCDSHAAKNSAAFKRGCQEAIVLSMRLIELSEDLFLLPTTLVHDIRRNLKTDSPAQSGGATPTATTPLRLRRCLRPEVEGTSLSDEEATSQCSPYRRHRHARRSNSPLNTSYRFASVSTMHSPSPMRSVVRDVPNILLSGSAKTVELGAITNSVARKQGSPNQT